MADHDALIDALSASAQPVRRPMPTHLRTMIWTALALGCGGLLVGLALRPETTDWSRPAAAWAGLELATSLALGVLAMAAAFDIAIAGRKVTAWPWLGAALAAWLGAVAGRLAASPEPVGHLGMGGYCYTFMLLAGAPMAVLAVVALRRTRALHPGRALALAGLGASFLALTLLVLCHSPQARLIDELGHLAAGATLIAATVLAGRRWVKVD